MQKIYQVNQNNKQRKQTKYGNNKNGRKKFEKNRTIILSKSETGNNNKKNNVLPKERSIQKRIYQYQLC